MTRSARLTDFQIMVGAMGRLDTERAVNIALFTSFELVRLWLKERKISAPFDKIVIEFRDISVNPDWHGDVTNVDGLCHVMYAVDLSELQGRAEHHRRVLGVTEHALQFLSKALGWQCDDLERFVSELRERPLPLVHYFEGLA